MQVVFGHVWGLWWWRNTQIQLNVNSLRTNITLDQPPTTAKELKLAGVSEIWQAYLKRGFPRDIPISLITRKCKAITRTNIRVRFWNGQVPFGAICIAGQQLTSSPEFIYVQIAGDISRICKEPLERWQHIVVLAELGCELCGTYSKQNTARGFKNRKMQLVSCNQMRDFACSIVHERGSGLAYEALRWVIDGLNSPMETVVYLMLCLPRAWGGFGCNLPKSNWFLPVPEHLVRKAKRTQIMPDLYWPEWNLVVEFFGEEAHEGHERRDYERREIEQDMGLMVVTFWKDDVANLDRFNTKAELVAHYLGMSPQENSDKFAAQQLKLQNMLMKHQRWV